MRGALAVNRARLRKAGEGCVAKDFEPHRCLCTFGHCEKER